MSTSDPQRVAGGGLEGVDVGVRLDFVSAGCNRLANAAAWHSSPTEQLVAFGAGSFVAIYDVEACRLLATLPAHTARVNCVRFLDGDHELPADQSGLRILSCSADKTIVESCYYPKTQQWEVLHVIAGHTSSVTVLAALSLSKDVLVASASADKSIKIWKYTPSNGGWSLCQTISFAPKMIESLALSTLPGACGCLLAAGGVDSLIHLYHLRDATDTVNFTPLLRLAGHEDWIRSLAFAQIDDGSLLLASSSQDTYIRLWKISSVQTDDPLLLGLQNRNNITDATSLSQKVHLFRLPVNSGGNETQLFSAMLESVLAGHEDWVYSVCWHPRLRKEDGSYHQPLRLLSASMDKTMMIWSPDHSSGVWLNEVRVGEMGGNTLGFYGGLYGANGNYVLAHGYNGAFHCWKRQQTSREDGTEEEESWDAVLTISGHFDEVADVCWSPDAEFLLSVSKDQTSRVFAQWKQENKKSWHEIGRPQIHGHDLSCVAILPGPRYQFVSGGEEKVIRVFDSPKSFLTSLSHIAAAPYLLPEEKDESTGKSRALGANVPPLGLSNKPVFTDSDIIDASDAYDDECLIRPAAPAVLDEPPLEELLLQSTLWPEIEKLYGHGNELVCVASDHQSEFIASACRGTTPEQSAIRVWNVKTWKEQAKLVCHTLTVTQLEFSHGDRFLLACSRDRDFSIFENKAGVFQQVARQKKAHERIIWSCSWSPTDDWVVTGSRDKTVKIWRWNTETLALSLSTSLPFESAVTAVSCTLGLKEIHGDNAFIIAAGFEDGGIALLLAKEVHSEGVPVRVECKVLKQFPRAITHVESVVRLNWRPRQEGRWVVLASCSTDHSLRVFGIDL